MGVSAPKVIKLTLSPGSVELTELPATVWGRGFGADPIRPSEADSGRRWLLVRGEKEGFATDWRSEAGSGHLDMLINLASGDLLLTRVLLKSGLKMGGQRRRLDYRGMNAVTYKKISG